MTNLMASPPSDTAAEAAKQEQLRAQMRQQQNWWKRMVQPQAPTGQTAQLKEALLQASKREHEANRREQDALTELAKMQEKLETTQASSRKQVEQLKAKLRETANASMSSPPSRASSSDSRKRYQQVPGSLQDKLDTVDLEMQKVSERLQILAKASIEKDEEAIVGAVKLQAQNEALLLQLESPQLQAVLVEKDELIKRLTGLLQEKEADVDESRATASREKTKADELEEQAAKFQREREADIAEAVAVEIKKTKKARDELATALEQLREYRLDDDRHLEQDQELRALRTSLEKATTRYNNLKGQYDELRAERKRATLAAEGDGEACSARDAELSFIKSEKHAVLEQLSLVTAERDAALEKMPAWERREADLLAECDAIKIECETLKKERADLSIEVENWSRMFSDLGQKHDELTAETHALKKEYAGCKAVQESEARKRSSSNEVEDLEKRLLTAYQDLETMSENLKEAERYRQLHANLDTEYELLKKEVAHLHYQIEELQQQQCKEEVEQLRLLTTTQAEELKRANHQAIEQSTLMIQMTSERDSAKADLEKLLQERSSHTAHSPLSSADALKWAELEDMIDKTNMQLEQANSHTAAAEARAATLLSEKEQLLQDLLAFKEQQATEKEAIERAESLMRSLTAENKQLKLKLQGNSLTLKSPEQRAVDIADRWVRTWKAPPVAETPSLLYLEKVLVKFIEMAASLVPLISANAAHRARLIGDLENGSSMSKALAVYRTLDSNGIGHLNCQNGEVTSFVDAIFLHLSLSAPPQHAQLAPFFELFNPEGRSTLDVHGCLCLVDAVLRSISFVTEADLAEGHDDVVTEVASDGLTSPADSPLAWHHRSPSSTRPPRTSSMTTLSQSLGMTTLSQSPGSFASERTATSVSRPQSKLLAPPQMGNLAGMPSSLQVMQMQTSSRVQSTSSPSRVFNQGHALLPTARTGVPPGPIRLGSAGNAAPPMMSGSNPHNRSMRFTPAPKALGGEMAIAGAQSRIAYSTRA